MKSPQKAIYRLLTGDSTVTSIVGQQIYPLAAPPTKRAPLILYAISDNLPQDTKNGASTIDVYEMQITMLSQSYSQSVDIGSAVRNALDRVTNFTFSDITLQLVYFIDEIEAFDKDIDQGGTFIRTQTYGIRTKTQ